MTWAKVDDHANEHRKQLAAGAEACWLWTCGLMYANRQAARDGFIPEGMIGMLYPLKNAAKLAAKLVEVGLWCRAPGGYQIHEFLVWNQTKEQRDEELAKGRARAAKSYARRHGGSSGDSSGEDETKYSVSSGSTPTPLPATNPKKPETTTQGLTGLGAGEASAGGGGLEPKIPCPADLQLTEQQAAMLESALFTRERQAEATQRFVIAEAANPAKTMTLTQWRKCLSMACGAALNNRNVDRPRGGRPPTSAHRQPDSGYRPSEHATEFK
jgi:hypothetical protein